MRTPSGDFSVTDLASDNKDEIINAARAYLNLCSEEFFLHRRGRIDGETWGIWLTGMRETARLPWIGGTWQQVRDEYRYYPEFCEFFDGCVAEAGGDVPIRSEATDVSTTGL